MKLHVIRQKTLPPFNGQKVQAIHQRLIILIADEKWASYSTDPFSLKVGQSAERYSPARLIRHI